MMVNNHLIRPYFLGGLALGWIPLDCHDKCTRRLWPSLFPADSLFFLPQNLVIPKGFVNIESMKTSIVAMTAMSFKMAKDNNC